MGNMKHFPMSFKNGSGAVRRKIDEVFGNTMSSKDKKTLATLIYYPREKMELIKKKKKIWRTGIRLRCIV